MKKRENYQPGDMVRFKKKHPCGGDIWEIIRIGMDFKVKCTTCGRIVMMVRRQFEKNIKEKVMEAEE